MVRLNHAVAVAMAQGPDAGLALLSALDSDGRLAEDHRLHSVRAHLLKMAGDLSGARASYMEAAKRTTNLVQQRHLHGRATRLE